MDPLKQLKQDIVSACRILSQQKLVEGFGHVSARIAGTDHFLITPRIGLALVKKTELLTMNLAGAVIDGAQPAPFEAWLHAAIMKAKPRVNAIARIHARGANIFSVSDRKLEPVHNHGSFFAGGVPVFSKPDLISNETLGTEVGDALGDQPAILLRGNGQVTVGRTIPEAVMMAIYLEEAAQILYGALQIGKPIPLTLSENQQRQTEALPPVDLERAWRFFKRQVGRD
ncbi:MAG TPA: class II aldolase/adducin family protein [Candidatus Saccharimonadales bacterium]|nr:class II aldolase/adducin family protein [Candidatus Saccharimonadales bacterium]